MRVLITLGTRDALHGQSQYYYERIWVNSLERHRGVYSHEARNCPDAEGDAAGQRLPGARTALHELLERRVCREADGRVSSLPHHLRIGSVICTRRMGPAAGGEKKDERRERVRDRSPGGPLPAR